MAGSLGVWLSVTPAMGKHQMTGTFRCVSCLEFREGRSGCTESLPRNGWWIPFATGGRQCAHISSAWRRSTVGHRTQAEYGFAD